MSATDESWFGLPDRRKPLVLAGTFLGIGLGGFFDGIVFHQVLQWHHMVSSHPDPAIATDLPINVFFDGLFHLLTYLFTIAGVGLLWRARNQTSAPTAGRPLFGSILMGWGSFNLVEGLVNHHLLGIHHVWPAGPGPALLWDLAYLGLGVLFLVGGYAIARSTPAARRR